MVFNGGKAQDPRTLLHVTVDVLNPVSLALQANMACGLETSSTCPSDFVQVLVNGSEADVLSHSFDALARFTVRNVTMNNADTGKSPLLRNLPPRA